MVYFYGINRIGSTKNHRNLSKFRLAALETIIIRELESELYQSKQHPRFLLMSDWDLIYEQDSRLPDYTHLIINVLAYV